MSDIPTPAEFRDGLALLAGGVTVLTTDGPSGVAGMTASTVCSVTDSPPTVLVCVNRSSFAHRFFLDNGIVCVNVLKAGQEAISALFADRSVSMAERFARTPHTALATGAPAIDGALVAMDGVIEKTHEVGTHSLFIVGLKVVRMCATHDARIALAYFDRGYHTLGSATSRAMSSG